MKKSKHVDVKFNRIFVQLKNQNGEERETGNNRNVQF